MGARHIGEEMSGAVKLACAAETADSGCALDSKQPQLGDAKWLRSPPCDVTRAIEKKKKI